MVRTKITENSFESGLRCIGKNYNLAGFCFLNVIFIAKKNNKFLNFYSKYTENVIYVFVWETAYLEFYDEHFSCIELY